MRTEEEVKAKLDELLTIRKKSLEGRTVWQTNNPTQQIKAIEWVLSMRDEL